MPDIRVDFSELNFHTHELLIVVSKFLFQSPNLLVHRIMLIQSFTIFANARAKQANIISSVGLLLINLKLPCPFHTFVVDLAHPFGFYLPCSKCAFYKATVFDRKFILQAIKNS